MPKITENDAEIILKKTLATDPNETHIMTYGENNSINMKISSIDIHLTPTTKTKTVLTVRGEHQDNGTIIHDSRTFVKVEDLPQELQTPIQNTIEKLKNLLKIATIVDSMINNS